LAKSSYTITFIKAKKSLIYSLFCSFSVYVEGGGWLKTSHGEKGLAESVRIPSYGGGSKIAQKNVI